MSYVLFCHDTVGKLIIWELLISHMPFSF